MAEQVVRERVTRDRFITVNEEAAAAGQGIKDIAATLGLSPAYVAQRRTALRSQGIPLTELPRGGNGNKASRDGALELLAKLRGVEVEAVKAAGDELIAKAAERKAEGEAAE